MIPNRREELLVLDGRELLITQVNTNGILKVFVDNNPEALLSTYAKQYEDPFTRNDLLKQLRKYWYLVDRGLPNTRLCLIRNKILTVPLQHIVDYKLSAKGIPMHKGGHKELPHVKRLIGEMFPTQIIKVYNSCVIGKVKSVDIVNHTKEIRR